MLTALHDVIGRKANPGRSVIINNNYFKLCNSLCIINYESTLCIHKNIIINNNIFVKDFIFHLILFCSRNGKIGSIVEKP